MFCEKCGNPRKSEGKFCTRCGASFTGGVSKHTVGNVSSLRDYHGHTSSPAFTPGLYSRAHSREGRSIKNRNMKLIIIASAVIVIGIIIVLLSTGQKNQLVGTWESIDYRDEIIFSKNYAIWFVSYDRDGSVRYVEEGTYSVNDNELRTTAWSASRLFRIDGNNLLIDNKMYTRVSSSQIPPEALAPAAPAAVEADPVPPPAPAP